MKYIFLGLLLSCTTFFTQALAQKYNPVKWETNAKHISNDEYELQFTALMQEGWNIYSQYLTSEDGPVKTSFTFQKGNHFQAIGKMQETGNKHEGFDKMFNMNIVKYSDKAVFTQRVKVSDAKQPIKGTYEFMSCNNEMCLPPKDADFSITLPAVTTVPTTTQPTKTVQSVPVIAAQPVKEATKPTTITTKPAEIQKKNAAPEKPTEKAKIDAPTTSKAENATIPAPTSELMPMLPSNEMQKKVHWTPHIQKINDSEYDLSIKGAIEKGWYVYSQFIGEGGPNPTLFTFKPNQGVELVGKVEEKSTHRIEGKDPVFEMKVIKFKDDLEFVQRVKVKDASQPLAGSFDFQTCNDKSCLPPETVPFSFAINAPEKSTIGIENNAIISPNIRNDAPIKEQASPVGFNFDKSKMDTSCGVTMTNADVGNKRSLWATLALGFLGGLLALLTPCVFPMIPFTVSFFTKRSKDRASGIKNALLYGFFIIAIYVGLGLVVTSIFGADALNLLSTNVWFNLLFGVLLLVFAFSFFGFYNIELPASWGNQSDEMARRGGILGIFFMAFTLALVSFSCTGPIIGTLLVETATGGGAHLFGVPLGPLVGMFGFALALALPFALFALFPAWLNSLPKSGSWMNSVKVTLGFVEIALALKFFSVADLTMKWKFLPYELFLGLWVLCAIGLALYYLGYIRFPHDSPLKERTMNHWLAAAIPALLGVYLLSGFGHSKETNTFSSLNLLSGLAPPVGHSYIYPKECPLNLNCYKDFFDAVTVAKGQNKPILIDFTGHGCVNCRRMEDQVWGQAGVMNLIRDKYVLVSLYVDERTKLETPYISPKTGRERKTIGNKWADFQEIHFEANSQPYYVLVSPDGKVLNTPVGYTPDKKEFQAFLECGLERFGKREMMSEK
jgi:thiol:disulfide interchange protein DsbD